MSTLTLNQRKQKNFRKSFFTIEATFYFLQGIYISGLIMLTDYQMKVLFELNYSTISTIILIIGIPTYVKMITALISDRVSIGKFGKRKPYLFIGAIVFAISFIFIFFISAYSVYYVGALLLSYVGFMFVDGTADAMTVDLTPSTEADRMQGFAQGGRYAGWAIGYLIGTYIAPVIGWNAFIIFLGIVAVSQAFVPMLFTEIEAPIKVKKTSLIESFKLSFGNVPAIQGLIFAVLFMGSIGITSIMGPLLLEKVGYQIYGNSRLITYISLAITTALTGSIMNKFGGFTNRNVFISFIIVWILLTPWLYVMKNWDNTAFVFLTQICMGISKGIVVVITYALIMPLCNSTVEGFMFATFTSVMNLGRGFSSKIIAFFGETLGWGIIPSIFVLLPIMAIGLLMVPGINKGIEKIKESNVELNELPS